MKIWSNEMNHFQMTTARSLLARVLLLPLFLLGVESCGSTRPAENELGGSVSIDGSSTVYPITEAVAEEFRNEAPSVRVTVGISGTGGGFKKFIRKEIAISNASRPIKKSELQATSANGVQFIELPVAYDGIAIVVNPQNDWVSSLTVEDLRRIWEPEAQNKVKRWNQVRSEWPNEEIVLFGPGVDSGTYDYFTQAIVGEEGASRGDFTSSEDDNVLVQGVVGDRYSMGFFGYAYYEENSDRLKLIPVDDGNPDNGEGPIAPSVETVANGTYQPLSRPVFIYVRAEAAERPEVEAFVDFYIGAAPDLVREVGYIALPSSTYRLVQERFDSRITGTAFSGEGSQTGITMEDLLSAESSN